jgi:hypothetical protein
MHPLQLSFKVSLLNNILYLTAYGERVNAPSNESMTLMFTGLTIPHKELKLHQNTGKSNVRCSITIPLSQVSPSLAFTLTAPDELPIVRYVPDIVFTPRAAKLDETKIPDPNPFDSMRGMHSDTNKDIMKHFREAMRKAAARGFYKDLDGTDFDFDDIPF